MKKFVVLIAIMACFARAACPVMASEVQQADAWKQAYLEYIVAESADTDFKEKGTYYHLMHVSDDSAPLLYISYGNYALGGRLCYYNETGIHSLTTNELHVSSIDLSIEYIEGSNMFIMSSGHMGFYSCSVYAWNGDEPELLGYGEYGASMGVYMEEDIGETAINSYSWENQDVSREVYKAHFQQFWDKMLQTDGEIMYAGSLPGYTYDEVLSVLTKSEEQTDAFSGVYVENAGENLAGSISFGFDGTFLLSVNYTEGFADVSGTYTKDDSGYITCQADDPDYNGVSEIIMYLDDSGLTMINDYWTVSHGTSFTYAGDFSPDDSSGTVTGDGVRIRSGPGTEYDVITDLDHGDVVSISGLSGNWYRVTNVFSFYSEIYGEMVYIPTIGFMSADYIARN